MNLFPSLLIDLELYAIVIGLSVALFVFLARERVRRLKEDPEVRETPLVEDKHTIPNPFARTEHTF